MNRHNLVINSPWVQNCTDSQTYNENLWESRILLLLKKDVPTDIFDDNNGRNLTLIEQYNSSDAVSQTRSKLGMYSGHSYLLFKKLEMQVYFCKR